ncbi:SLBB domain-containing protein [Pedococcus sp. P5_B7]
MPSRRRPSEPSARVRALLESTDGRRALALGEPGRPVGDVVPWLPERSWVEASAAEPARVPGRVDRVDRVDRTGRPDRSDRPDQPDRPARAGRHRRPVPPGPRFLTVPTSLRGARLGGPRAAAAGLLLVVLVAAVAFGVRVAWARAASTPQVVAPSAAGSALGDQHPGGSVFASSSTASGGGGPPAVGTVTVHVVGQVKRPGVFTMPAGSRVADAVAKAGAGKGADLAAINLARPLVDGEQIHVPKPGEVLASGGGGSGAGGAASAAGSAGTAGSAGSSGGG